METFSMKRIVLQRSLAFSLIGMATTAHAQSSVMLYGLLDAGISYVSNEGGHANVKFDSGILVPNLLGLRGTEDLGAGTRAIFNLVDQFIVGNGAIIPWQGLFGRNAYAGIASDHFGTLTFGNQYDFMVDSLLAKGNDPAYMVGLYGFRTGPFGKIAIPNNPPSAGSFDWDRMAGGHPVNSSVKYQSIDFAGFSFGGLYGFGGVPGSFGSGNSISAGINYDSKPFSIGAAYTEVKYYSAGQPEVGIRNWGIGAHYQFDKVTLTALVTTVRNTFNGGAIAEGQIGVAYQPVPYWSTSFGYMYMKGNQYLDNNHAHQLSAIVDYILSKRTVVYAETVYQRTNSGAQALINGVLDPSGASSGPNQLIARIGLKTSY